MRMIPGGWLAFLSCFSLGQLLRTFVNQLCFLGRLLADPNQEQPEQPLCKAYIKPRMPISRFHDTAIISQHLFASKKLSLRNQTSRHFMRKSIPRIFLFVFLLAQLALPKPATATASNAYWDVNGSTAGAGTTGIGNWSSSSWSSSSSGSATTGSWIPGSTAVFAAGTDATNSYSVNSTVAQTLAGFNFEEGTVTITGSSTFNLISPAVIDVSSSHLATISAIIGGSAGLIKTNTGTLVLTGVNTFSGAINIVGGILAINAPSAAGTGNSTLTLNGGTLRSLNTTGSSLLSGRPIFIGTSGGSVDLVSGVSVTHSSSISGSGPLIKSGVGTLTLSGANSNTGAVTVDSGTLKVANTVGSATGTGAVTVNSAATLSGNGTISGAAYISGTVSPDNSLMNTTTLYTGDETWNGGGSYKWEINGANGTAGVSLGWDLISISGGLTINASSANPFSIDITSLTTNNAVGSVYDFDNSASYIWSIVTTRNGITGFDPTVFRLLSNNFANSLGSGFFVIELANNNNDIVVRFVHAPSISTQPVNLTTNAGSSAFFSAVVSGTQPLTYQWKKDGNLLTSGPNSSTLFLSQVFVADAGTYSFTVANSYGSATSSGATLVVVDPVIISSPTPQNQTVGVGSTVSFNATAAGTAQLSHQWKKNGGNVFDGGNVFGATTSTLTLANLALSDSGSYSLNVANANNVSVTSDSAILTVINPPTIVIGPTSITENAGDTAGFSVAATGANLVYQWKKGETILANGNKISGANTADLTIVNVLAEDFGTYTAIVSNEAGSVYSGAALTVIDPIIVSQPADLAVGIGSNATFSVGAYGTDPLNYQWKQNGNNLYDVQGYISGAMTSSLTINSASKNDSGTYTVFVYNQVGSLTSSDANLTVCDVPQIIVQPEGQTNNTGAYISFNVVASGGALNYQWKKNGDDLTDGGNISGAATDTLYLSGLNLFDAGDYSVKVSNVAGDVTSDPATLSVFGIQLNATKFLTGAGSDVRGTGISIASGAIYVSGTTGILGTDGLIARYDLPLTMQSFPVWFTNWPGQTGPDNFNSIVAMADGVYAAGDSFSQTTDLLGGKQSKGMMAKFPITGPSPTGGGFGGTLWSKQVPSVPGAFSFSGYETLNQLTLAKEGSITFIYATGAGQSGSANAGRLFLSKLKQDSTILWTVTDPLLSTAPNAYSSGRAVTAFNGNTYVAGRSEDSGSPHALIQKYSSTGARLWSSAPSAGQFNGITSFGGAIFAVGTTSTESNHADFLIEKRDESGNVIWSRTYDNNASKNTLNGVIGFGSRLYAVGSTRGSDISGAMILEIDPSNGDIINPTLFGGSFGESANGVTTDGMDLYIVGEARGFEDNHTNLMMLRYQVLQPVVPLNITTTALPIAQTNLAYTAFLQAVGGVPPYTWLISSGSLPAGLTLSNNIIKGTPTQTGSFPFVVQVADSADTPAIATSSFTLTSIPPNAPPTVSLTSPVNGSTYVTPTAVTLSADASDSDGVAQVDFYSGTVLIGTVTSTPYNLVLTDLSAGAYSFQAVATDIYGATKVSATVHITVNNPGVTTIDFEALDANAGEVTGITLSNYLSSYGVTLSNVTAGSRLVVNSDAHISSGTATKASSGNNLFTQVGVNGFTSYKLCFAQSYATVSFTRTRLIGGTHGVINPSWRAVALDSSGTELGSVGEDQTTSYADVSAQVYTLFGPNIAAVRIDADNHNFAQFNSVLLDDLVLSANSTGNYPPTVNITSPANNDTFTEPAQVIVTATADDSDGTISQIAFYLGNNFIGSGSSSPASVTLGNLAAGTYTFKAVATDNAGATRSSTPVTITVNPTAGTSVINFDSLNASAGNVNGSALSNYLAGFGVRLSNVTRGSRLEAINAKNLFGGTAVAPSSPNNLFAQDGLNDPLTFTLNFATPLQSVRFTRVGLLAGANGISAAQWKARIFNSAGLEMGSVQESQISSFTNVPARSFELVGLGITSLRFDSDGHHSATFASVLLDDLVVNTNTVTNPLTVQITSPSGGTTYTAPADITITADATNASGTIDHVDFYAGPNLIGTASSSPYSIVWNSVLAGSYSLTAKAFDSSGFALISAPVGITVNSGAAGNSALINFDSLDASSGNVSGSTLSDYLGSRGIVLKSISSGTSLVVQNEANISGGNLVVAPSPHNILTQYGSDGPVSFTLGFNTALQQFQMTRPKLMASSSGVTLPAWRATAYDSAGVKITDTGEDIVSSYSDIAAQTFTLDGPGISTVKIESSGTTFTTFNAVLLDDFLLTTSTTNIPPSVVITSPADRDVFTAPAKIPITAIAADGDGSVTQVKFYVGANNTLIGTANATASPYSITWSNVAVGHYFIRAQATDDSGATKWSSAVNIFVQPSAFVFGILTQPQDQTVATGGAASFTVVTTGTGLITYQWRYNGTPIDGETDSTLSLPGVSAGQAGTYSVVCTSGITSITSDDAVLTVLDAPTITTQPEGQSVSAGDTATFTVEATGAAPLSFQWRLNGHYISGATDSAYTITAAQPSDSGNYSVLVKNSVGFVESDHADLSVAVGTGIPDSADNFADRIEINPLAGPVVGNNESATKEFGEPDHADKKGGKSIWYTWHATFTGVISLTTKGSSFDTLLAVYTGTDVSHLTVVASDDDGGDSFTSLVTFNVVENTDYQIAIDGRSGASGNVVLGLTAGDGYRVFDSASGEAVPRITLQPIDQIVNAGDTVSLDVAASSPTTLSYQWFFNLAPIQGATDSSLVISNFQDTSIGRYYVLVGNDAGSVPSLPVVIQIGTSDFTTGTIPSQDKFGDASDLSGSSDGGGGSGSHPGQIRPHSGGDSRGYSVSQVFSTVGSTKEDGEPSPCGQAGGASEWYTYTAPTNGLLHINTDGSTFNTILGVYIGPGDSFTTLTNVGCGYTTNYLTDGQPHVYITNAPANQKYYIVVDGVGGVSGTVHLNISLGDPPTIVTPPQDESVSPNSNATFTVSVTGSTNFTYRWRLNSSYIAGATSSSYTVTNAQDAAAGNYTAVVSNLVSVVTSTPPAVLTIQYAPLVATQPTNQTVLIGANATITLGMLGASPLCYNWLFNDTSILHATNSSLTITNCKTTNSGSYTVVVTNSYGSTTSAVAVLTVSDVTPPAIKLISPAANYKTSASPLAVTGSASDNVSMTGVVYRVGLVNPFQAATLTGTAHTNWTAAVGLDPGTNVVYFKSIDSSGNESTLTNRSFIFAAKAPLTVRTNGLGKVTSTVGAVNGASLEIFKSYTIAASMGPGTNWVFTNWTSGTSLASLTHLSTNASLTFTMQTNLILQANFVTNPFTAVSGVYNGLFYPDSGVTERSSGFFTVKLASTSKGLYTGTLKVDNGSYGLSGTFDLTGSATKVVTRTGKTPVTVYLHLDLVTPDDQISGSVSNVAWLSTLLGDRATFSASNKATNYSGKYTMIIPPTNNFPVDSPGGYGYATITNNDTGTVSLTGYLADGSAISQSVPISKDGHMPLYVSLYSGKGSLLGWVNFTNAPPKNLSANLSWIKTNNVSGLLYVNGFTNQVDVMGSLYTPLPNSSTRIINLTTGVISMTDGNLSAPLDFNVSLSTANVVAKTDGQTNALTVTFTGSTGAMVVTFHPTGVASSYSGKGAVLQNQTNVFGYFLGPNQSGSIWFH